MRVAGEGKVYIREGGGGGQIYMMVVGEVRSI